MTLSTRVLAHERTRNAIFVALDEKFLAHGECFFECLNMNWPAHPDVIVHIPRGSAALIKLVSKYPRTYIIEEPIPQQWVGPVMEHLKGIVSPSTFYARLVLWSNLMYAYETILHLDVDLVVLEPLDSLFANKDFTIFAEAYHDQNNIFYNHLDPELVKLLEEREIKLSSITANAGVFVMPRSCRESSGSPNIFELLELFAGYLRWADQSLINLWMAAHRLEINTDIRWNFQARELVRDRQLFKQAKIFHLNGVQEPLRLKLMLQICKIQRSQGSRESIGDLVLAQLSECWNC